MAAGEAILFFNRKLAEDFDYRQAGRAAGVEDALSVRALVGMLEIGTWLAQRGACQRLRNTPCSRSPDCPGWKSCFPFKPMPSSFDVGRQDREARDRGCSTPSPGEGPGSCLRGRYAQRVDELAADLRQIALA
jgi:threonine aldolase